MLAGRRVPSAAAAAEEEEGGGKKVIRIVPQRSHPRGWSGPPHKWREVRDSPGKSSAEWFPIRILANSANFSPRLSRDVCCRLWASGGPSPQKRRGDGLQQKGGGRSRVGRAARKVCFSPRLLLLLLHHQRLSSKKPIFSFLSEGERQQKRMFGEGGEGQEKNKLDVVRSFPGSGLEDFFLCWKLGVSCPKQFACYQVKRIVFHGSLSCLPQDQMYLFSHLRIYHGIDVRKTQR